MILWLVAIFWRPKARIDEWDDLLDGDVTDWQDHYYVQSER